VSDFLFARPSVIEGIGRNVDLFGVMQRYNSSETPEQADRRAFMADVDALRKDMKTAVNTVIHKK